MTLLEIIVVLLVLVSMMITVVPRISLDEFTVESQAQRFASDLRRAQLLATQSARSVCVTLSGGAGYAVYPVTLGSCIAVAGQELQDPATGRRWIVNLSGNATITSTPSATPLIFDSWGAPTAGAVTYNLSGRVAVNVSQATGYVSLSPL